jgi:MOSC domain-containing protein YiiM
VTEERALGALVGRIVSIQVGMPREMVTATGRVWKSAIEKAALEGPVALGAENLAGDYQANRKYHGGPDKALCTYASEHYPDWRERLGLDMPFGAFGENLTLEGLTEDRVCVGDVFAIGDGGVRVQVSQPRQPCANLSKRWNRPRLPRWMEENGHTGFYLRALRTGDLAAGDAVTLVERPHPGWNLLRANELVYAAAPDREELAALRGLAALSAEWKRILGRKLTRSAAG